MNRACSSCIIGVSVVALLSGCSRTSLRSDLSHPKPLPAAVAGEFSYHKQTNSPCRVASSEQKTGYAVKRVELQVPPAGSETNRSIELDYYDPDGTQRTPAILVLPMLGGGYGIERYFAGYFASRGYAAIIVRRDRRSKAARLEDINRIFKEMVIDHKRVIDWVETQPDLDSARLGIFGISMGGIKGSLLLPLEDRIKAAALGLVGGDLAYILTHSTESGLVKRRDQELRERNMTLAQAEEYLRGLFNCDPLHFAPYVDPRKVLLVLARYDDVVPIEKGLELKEKMGNPETIMLPAGHFSAALSIGYVKAEAFGFFEKRFADAGPNLAGKGTGGSKRIQAGRR